MRKILLFALLIMLIIPTILPLAKAATLTVGPGGQYTKIQDAIDAAQDFDTVTILDSYNSITAGETFPVTVTIPHDITITGEVDANGIPLTTIDIAPPTSSPHDGFIIVTDRVTFSNLNIIDSSNNVEDISRTIALGSFVNDHNDGFQIRNVVIDLTGPNGWHGVNALDLIASNVIIDNNTIIGATGSAIILDGDTYTITNNQITGIDDSNNVLLDMGIAFGDDLPGPACSGVPNDYTISDNTIIGVTDGIIFCNGENILISNNQIQDANRAIETAGSRLITISGNNITWNKVGGIHGIGVSASESITITDNQVIGRSAKDTDRGIVVGSSINTQIQRNRVENCAGDGLIFIAESGVTTQSTIEDNTVYNNGGNGLTYMGADNGATNGDSTILRNNIVEDNQRNGIIFLDVKGMGNIVAGNQIRSNNKGLYSGTHGFNLQGLKNTLIEENQAFDTMGSGAGFFIANSQSLSGGCNIGANNGGGLLVQVNVNPTFTNPTTNCPSRVQGIPISEAGNIVNANEGDVYFIYPDYTGNKPPGVSHAILSDWTAAGYVIGMSLNIQNEATDTNTAYIYANNGNVKLQNKSVVLFGGPVVNAPVKYYEKNRIAPLYFRYVSGVCYWYRADGTCIDESGLPHSQTNSRDMFVVMAFLDESGNKVLIIYGYGWKGTFAGGKFFKFVIYPNIANYSSSYYIFEWIDNNGDGFVDLNEISETPISQEP